VSLRRYNIKEVAVNAADDFMRFASRSIPDFLEGLAGEVAWSGGGMCQGAEEARGWDSDGQVPAAGCFSKVLCPRGYFRPVRLPELRTQPVQETEVGSADCPVPGPLWCRVRIQVTPWLAARILSQRQRWFTVARQGAENTFP